MNKIKYLLYKYKIFKIIKLNGVLLNIYKLHYHKNELIKLISGKYEMGENAIMSETLMSEDILLELGTGIGYNSIYAKKNIGCEVFSFEGNPELITIINENAKLNKAKITVYNKIVAVKKTVDYISFNVAEHYTGSSLGDLDAQTNLKSIYEIETISIKEVINQISPTYFMCDIEGGELDIFENCDFLKDSTIKKILIEFHPRVLGEDKTLELINNIIKQGYQLRFDKYPKKYCFFFKK
jgi:FkbM family methyltransferase